MVQKLIIINLHYPYYYKPETTEYNSYLAPGHSVKCHWELLMFAFSKLQKSKKIKRHHDITITNDPKPKRKTNIIPRPGPFCTNKRKLKQPKMSTVHSRLEP